MIKIDSIWPNHRIEEYAQSGFSRIICPVCHNETFDNDAICPHCDWQYDYSIGYSCANRGYKWTYRIKYFLTKLLRK
jgi:predicted amidophosphoribosyltransferase